MQERNSTETTLRDFYDVLFRHKRRSLVFFFCVMIAVALFTFLSPEIFRSEATLMVRLGRESVSLDPTATTGQVVGIGMDKENEINSELAILQSRELAEKVVDAVGTEMILNGPDAVSGGQDSASGKGWQGIRRLVLDPGRALSLFMRSGSEPDAAEAEWARDKAVRFLMKNLFVETTKKSSIISISYDARSPEMARDVLTRLIGLYLDKHINAHRTTGSYGFFDQQKEEAHKALENIEKELKGLKDRTGVSALTDQRRIILERAGSLQREWERTQSDMAASAAAIHSLQKKLAGMPEMGVITEISGAPNSAADELQKRFNELKLKEQELLSVYSEGSIPVLEMRRQIEEAQRLLEKTHQPLQITTGINVTCQELRLLLVKEESGLPSLRARAEALKEQLLKAAGELTALNETEMRLTRLQREMDIQESNYRKYATSLEQSRIDHELETQKISNISVVQQASYSIKPVRPNKIVNLALGFCLGIFGGLGLAFLSEYLDHSIRKPEDIHNKLHLPMLAAIPIMTSPGLSSLGFPFQPLSPVPVPPGSTDGGNVPLSIETQERSESLRKCLLQPVGSPPKILSAIAVTSCHSGDGVSTVAAYITGLLAEQSEGRVLIVDANLERPAQHRIFGVQPSPGLIDMLARGEAGAIQNSPIANVDVLAAGEGNVNFGRGGTDLKSLAELLTMLRHEYTHIVFDIPALWDDASGVKLASAVDGVILVVEAEKTRWEVARHSQSRLIEAQANVMGIVLNKRRFHMPEWLYKTL
jgi:uncharacterized protein involved in exopolysaccharide biosynthesis/Mrp family chromosome partitioning ATPase